ncbi:MAG TPA: HEAT repeat domain-containing protein [Gemmataceae bacterium]|jgi:HEAT repeat protein|nr:HEAT repeat domain-containing protein [Gemmataceae bacterium]
MAWRSPLISLYLLASVACTPGMGQEEEIVLGKKRSEWLTILKEHKETKFRRAAVVVLGVLGPRVKGVVDALYDAVENDPDPEVRREIVLTVGRMGSEAKGAADVLGDVLKRDTAGAVREAAALTLAGKLNDQAFTQVFRLADALKDPHPGTRAAAAEALKNLGEKAKIVLPKLTALAQDQKADRFPRLYAIQMISKWGDDGTLKVLVGIFEDKEALTAVRHGALEGIGRLGDKAEPAIPVLARALSEKDVELRRAAALALCQVGDKVRDAWPAIKAAYRDGDNAVRNQVIRLTGSIGKDKEAVSLLAEAAEKDANLENRLAALQELGHLGSTAMEALPTLSRLSAEDVRASVREAALAAVSKIKGAP